MSSANQEEISLVQNFNLEELKTSIFSKIKSILDEDLLMKIVHILEEFLYKEVASIVDRNCNLEKDLTFSKFSCDVLNEENSILKAKSEDHEIIASEDKFVQTENNDNEESYISSTKLRQSAGGVEESSDAPWTGVTDFQKEVENVANEATVYFDEKSGMYFNKATNYYYCPTSGLYYDYKSGIYFYYNYESEDYEFHSQVDVVNESNINEDVRSPKSVSSLEEGEWQSDAEPSPSSPLPRTTAPCLRLVVKEGALKGQLFMVTIEGGSVGTAEGQDVLIDCSSVSRNHAIITYSSRGTYDHHFYIRDTGSTNGTYVNGKLLAKDDDKAIEIGHGWELRCGDVLLGCHIHPGSNTCNECEPGLITSAKEKKKVVKFDKEKERRRQLRILKKKAGMSLPAGNSTKYADRASGRRAIVGSDNPYEKTQMASIDEEIDESNVGYKMLKKMGWTKGEGLGASGEGRIDPVIPTVVERMPQKIESVTVGGKSIKKTLFVKSTD